MIRLFQPIHKHYGRLTAGAENNALVETDRTPFSSSFSDVLRFDCTLMEQAAIGAGCLHHAHRCQISHLRLQFFGAIRQREVCDFIGHSREGLRSVWDLQPREMRLPEFSTEVLA